MKVSVLKILSANELIAFLTLTEGEGASWADPFGGVFTQDEQAQMTEVSMGMSSVLTLHAGTRWEKTMAVRLAARYEGGEA